MVTPLSPVSDEKLEFQSSSSDACCTGSPHSLASEAYNTCYLREHGQEASPVYVQEYPLTLVEAHVQDPSPVPNGDASVQNSEECQHAVHMGSMDQLSKATHTSVLSNSHVHIASSSSGATFIPMKGPSTGVMSICGMRSEMEDAVTIAHSFLFLSCQKTGGCSGTCLMHVNEQGANTPLHFFGVYDGHGGSQVSKFCKDRLHITLANEFQSCNDADQNESSSTHIPWEKCWEKAMFSTFHKMDAEIEGFTWRGAPQENGSVRERISEPLAPETVGSTAVVAVVGSCQIIIANCGDSRAVLSRGGQAVALSVDHKVGNAAP